MGLADYKPVTRVINLQGGSFEVRGLSLEDFSTLVQHHLPDLEAVYTLGQSVLGGRADITEEDLKRLIMAVLVEAPGFSANLIAMSSGETSAAATEGARKLPFPVQIKTLLDIIELTFMEVGGVGKAIGLVVEALKQKDQVKKAITGIEAP